MKLCNFKLSKTEKAAIRLATKLGCKNQLYAGKEIYEFAQKYARDVLLAHHSKEKMGQDQRGNGQEGKSDPAPGN